MKSKITWVLFCLFTFFNFQNLGAQESGVCLSCSDAVFAQAQSTDAEAEKPAAPVYGGCICDRAYLSGNWFGRRSAMAQSGITFTGDITNYYQGVVSGGREQHFKLGAHSDYIFDLDMDKVAGAEGMFVRVRGESQLGEFINRDAGSLLAANASGLFPTAGGTRSALTEFTITQFLSETFAVFGGKLQTMDGDLNAFAHGRGKTQFMNVALAANPLAFRTVPYSSLGFGFVVLGKEQTPVLTVTAIDPIDRSTTFNLDDIFEEGVTLNAEAHLPTNFLGKPGHQLFGAIWSSRDVALLAEGPRLLLPNVATPTSSDSWAAYWNFDQYLMVNPHDETRGWGVFGRAGFADDETNPLEWFMSYGIGGSSWLPCRGNDTFGAGFYHGATSDQLPRLILGGDGTGVELFYNAEMTPWFHLTTDVQYINSGVNGVEDAYLFGLRGKVDF